MPWMSYESWAGPVQGARVRVSVANFPVGAAAFGASLNPLSLRAGAVGTLVNVLPVGTPTPAYLIYARKLNLDLAGEIVFSKRANEPVMWVDFHTMLMPDDDVTVVVPRVTLDKFEIEYA